MSFATPVKASDGSRRGAKDGNRLVRALNSAASDGLSRNSPSGLGNLGGMKHHAGAWPGTEQTRGKPSDGDDYSAQSAQGSRQSLPYAANGRNSRLQVAVDDLSSKVEWEPRGYSPVDKRFNLRQSVDTV